MFKGNFIERSIEGALSFLKESLFAEEYAAKKGFLQARDSRAKAAAILAILLSVIFSHSAGFIMVCYSLCLFLAVVSSIGLVFFLKRTWFFIPLFALCIAVPALFAAVTPGEPALSFKFFILNCVITKQGLAGAEIFFLRVLTSVSLCVLLVLTTRQNVLLKTLRIFGIPAIFVMTMGMCYRYLYLFIEIIHNGYSAIKSRVGRVSSSGKGRVIAATAIGGLWRRSYDMYEDVHSAMVSRGYNGEPKVMEDFRFTAKDIFWFVVAIMLLLITIWQTYFLN